ncbi:MAG: DUF1641 domain-containing protein [Proteobacteria bacterium]|nr:DUF1641 domain-containing protein [Pseudomonadota bacterium]
MTNVDTPASSSEAPDLAKLIELAAAISSAQDAMTDDIVTRLASAMGEGMILMDRLTRNQGLMSLLQALNQPAVQDSLECLAEALRSGSVMDAVNAKTPKTGGYGGLLRMAKDPDVQDAIYTLARVVKGMNPGGAAKS